MTPAWPQKPGNRGLTGGPAHPLWDEPGRLAAGNLLYRKTPLVTAGNPFYNPSNTTMEPWYYLPVAPGLNLR